MAAVFAISAWFFALQPLAVAYGNWWMARDYQVVEASVVERKGSDANGSFNWYAARYERGGHDYETHRLTVLDNEDIDERSNAVVFKSLANAYQAKQPMNVWVSPRKPEVAIVTRDLPIASLWARWPIAIGFFVLAIAGLLGALGRAFSLSYYPRMADAAGLWLFSSLWCAFIFPMLLLVVLAEENPPGVLVVVIGVFALIGGLFIYGAVASSLFGTATPESDAAGERGTQLADKMFSKHVAKQQKKANKAKK